MAKTIIKEAFIMILLCVAIALILAVIFYDYVPINKTVPQPVAYSMPEELSEIEEELESGTTASETSGMVPQSETIDEVDLAGYMQTKVYDAGKADPFSVYKEEPKDTNTITEPTNTTGSNNNSNSGSTGTIFETGNIK